MALHDEETKSNEEASPALQLHRLGPRQPQEMRDIGLGRILLALLVAVVGLLMAAPSAQAPFMSVDELRPGMAGVGQTVFHTHVHVLGGSAHLSEKLV